MASDSVESTHVPRRQLHFEERNDTNGDHDILNQCALNNLKDVDRIHSSMSDGTIPVMDMEFENEEKAWAFYLAYAKKVGFGVRRSKCHKDKYGNLISRTFCCSAQGKRGKDKRDFKVKTHRAETRFGCEARMRIHTRYSSKFRVIEFVKEHNHYLSSPSKTHLHRSHRKVTPHMAAEIEMANNVGIAPKAAHELLARKSGGRENIGFIPEDYRNYLRSKRTKDVKIGDTGGVLEYLHKMQYEDPNFFYAIQVDEDDLITNIFWSDAKMRTDFANFGDVVCFDTTYRKNNEGRPIALFVGVNHHKQTVIFGAALLYDETALTFEWLFDTFTRAMSGAKPKTILTDQDAAMAKALVLRWPETHHRLCIWHIYQNAANHLSSVFHGHKSFSSDFSRCIYDFDEEDEFVEEWDKMLEKYGLIDNEWLKRMFRIRDKWALVYGRQMFCADMTTTQRSESMNSVLKRYVNYKYKFLEFFTHFERLIEDRRYDELKADFKANISFPALSFPCELLRTAAIVYTPEVFEYFKKEWCKSIDSNCQYCGEVGSSKKYEVTPSGKRYHHTVLFNYYDNKFDCSCRKFEFGGMLCSHILKVFILENVLRIPSEYIMKRWTRKAKTGYVASEDSFKNNCNLDPKVLFSMRYKELCRLSLQLVTKAAETDEAYDTVKNGMLKMLEAVDTILQAKELIDQNSREKLIDLNENEMVIDEVEERVKGIKAKVKSTSGKRLKSGLERGPVKKRSANKNVADSTATRLPVSSCVEQTTEDNLRAMPFIPVTEWPNYFQQLQQFGPDKDAMNLFNPASLQFQWGMPSSQLNQQANLDDHFVNETSCSAGTANLMETQQSQILHQGNMINTNAIGVTGGANFVGHDAVILGIPCIGDCDCPFPHEVGWCKKWNKRMDI